MKLIKLYRKNGWEMGDFNSFQNQAMKENLLYVHQTIKDAKTDSSVVGIIMNLSE